MLESDNNILRDCFVTKENPQKPYLQSLSTENAWLFFMSNEGKIKIVVKETPEKRRIKGLGVIYAEENSQIFFDEEKLIGEKPGLQNTLPNIKLVKTRIIDYKEDINAIKVRGDQIIDVEACETLV